MSLITLTNELTNGTTADADKVMDNFEDITNVVNGSLDEDNISSSTALTVASLTSTGQITTSIADGTAPLVITSTTVVDNLNVDQVDGYDISSGMADKTRTICLTAAGAICATTNGANKNQIEGTNFNYYQLEFDKDTDESAYWIFPVPDQYDGGNVVFTVKSICASATEGDVLWMMTTNSVGDSATWDDSLGTTITFSAKTVDGTAGDTWEASKTADPGWTAGETAILRLYRDTSGDDLAEDADMLEVKLEYEVT